MGILEGYFENVRGIQESFPPQDSVIKRVSIKLFSLVAAVETESWRHLPAVDSPEVIWNQGSQEQLAKELKEILHEPESVS